MRGQRQETDRPIASQMGRRGELASCAAERSMGTRRGPRERARNGDARRRVIAGAGLGGARTIVRIVSVSIRIGEEVKHVDAELL